MKRERGVKRNYLERVRGRTRRERVRKREVGKEVWECKCFVDVFVACFHPIHVP